MSVRITAPAAVSASRLTATRVSRSTQHPRPAAIPSAADLAGTVTCCSRTAFCRAAPLGPPPFAFGAINPGAGHAGRSACGGNPFRCHALGPLDSADADELDMESLIGDTVDSATLGQRGELFFIGQIFLFVFVMFGLPENADVGAKLVGVISALLGTIAALYGVKNLGNSLTPFPKPRDSNKLVTSGVYGYVRHPMYTGLLCLGFASVTFNFTPAKFATFCALIVLLDAKAALEEEFLVAMHGDRYREYMKKVGKFLPYLDFLGPDTRNK